MDSHTLYLVAAPTHPAPPSSPASLSVAFIPTLQSSCSNPLDSRPRCMSKLPALRGPFSSTATSPPSENAKGHGRGGRPVTKFAPCPVWITNPHGEDPCS